MQKSPPTIGDLMVAGLLVILIRTRNKKVVFCGMFTAGDQLIEINDHKLNIIKDGKNIKFKKHVEQITFSGKYAREVGQSVLYVTERAVFTLTDMGLKLIEIAPGVNLQKHILDKMEFSPIISKNLKLMDECIFSNEIMKIKNDFLKGEKNFDAFKNNGGN